MNEMSDELTEINLDHQKLIEHIRKSVSSGSINFLFGAGVNGDCFPMMSQFKKTKEKLIEFHQDGNNIESELTFLSESERNIVLNTFVNEYNEYKNPDTNADSYNNLKTMLQTVSHIVEKTENRRSHTKKVNIFTLNYDNIVENILKELGIFHHMIAANYGNEQSTADIVGFNVTKNKFVPSFFISKIHGSANSDGTLEKDKVILPNKEKKISSALSREFFRVLFKMKSELEIQNAILFIIGYSGGDEDVNGILREAAISGLTTYWLKYNSSDTGVENLNLSGLTIVESDGNDSTKKLNDLFEEVLR